ncbi:hypothetical protein ACEPAF_211 [Sanghuangporus sanghuang]
MIEGTLLPTQGSLKNNISDATPYGDSNEKRAVEQFIIASHPGYTDGVDAGIEVASGPELVTEVILFFPSWNVIGVGPGLQAWI